MERISIFNYEAFYLDFLEGNLGEEDTVLLLAFLEKNPSLELLDAELPTLNDEASSLSVMDKENLKQVDEEASINLNNVEHFLIAQQEGILPTEKSTELDSFVAGNATLEKERGYIQSAILVPDTSIVYSEKADLKQKKVFVLWPYIISVAAACLVFFIWMNLNGSEEVKHLAEGEKQKIDQVEEDPTEDVQNQQSFVAEQEDQEESVLKNNVYVAPKVYEVPSPNVANGEKNPTENKKPRVERLERRSIKTSLASVDEMEVQSIISTNNLGADEVQTEDPLWGFGNTNNPIEPITAGIKKRFNTDVDFRSKKSTNEKSGGFFLKIGKFEIARKKH